MDNNALFEKWYKENNFSMGWFNLYENLKLAYIEGQQSTICENQKLTDQIIKMRELLKEIDETVDLCEECRYQFDKINCQCNHTEMLCFKIKEVLSEY